MSTRFVTYNRVSTDDQVGGTSLDWQRDQQRAWGQREGWDHVEDIFDGGQSGAKLDRAGVQRTMELLKDKQVDVVCFFAVDRAARAQRVFEDLWTAIYTLDGRVAIHQKGKVYPTLDLLMGDTVWDRAMAEQERYSIQNRTAIGFEQHLRAGSYIFRPVYGYYLAKERKDGLNTNVLKLDAAAVPVVRRIINMTVEGHGYQRVADVLNEQGHPAPMRGPWSLNGVANILRHREKYAGRSFLKSRKVRDERIEVEYRYPALIEEAKLKLLEQAIASKSRGPSEAVAPFRGVIWCSSCKSPGMAGGTVTRRHPIICSSQRRARRNRQQTTPCRHSVSVNVIARELLRQVEGGAWERSLWKMRVRLRELDRTAKAARTTVGELEAQRQELEGRLLSVDALSLPRIASVLEGNLKEAEEKLLEARRRAQRMETTHLVAKAKAEALPKSAEPLVEALKGDDFGAIRELVQRMGIRVLVDFSESDQARRWGSIKVQLVIDTPD